MDGWLVVCLVLYIVAYQLHRSKVNIGAFVWRNKNKIVRLHFLRFSFFLIFFFNKKNAGTLTPINDKQCHHHHINAPVGRRLDATCRFTISHQVSLFYYSYLFIYLYFYTHITHTHSRQKKSSCWSTENTKKIIETRHIKQSVGDGHFGGCN